MITFEEKSKHIKLNTNVYEFSEVYMIKMFAPDSFLVSKKHLDTTEIILHVSGKTQLTFCVELVQYQ